MAYFNPLDLNANGGIKVEHHQPNDAQNTFVQQIQNPFLQNGGFYNIMYPLYTNSLFTTSMPQIDYSHINYNYQIYPPLNCGSLPYSYDLGNNNSLFKPKSSTLLTSPATNKAVNDIKYKNTKDFANKAKLGPEFLNKVKQVAKNLNCNYKDLLAIMNSESGVNPQCRGSIAVGLIQFTNSAIAALNKKYGLNLTKEKILAMSGVEQMDLVEKYIMMSKVTKFPKDARLTGADLYALIFLPGYADREVLCSEGDKYYASNKGVDIDKDGKITKSDLTARLAKKGVAESKFMNVA